MRALHHLEIWTNDLAGTAPGWVWLFAALGWTMRPTDPGWVDARVWEHGDGSYLVLEQSSDGTGERARRTEPGMNHLALTVPGTPDEGLALLDQLRAGAVEQGWGELFGELYPHAGAAGHTALFLANGEGIEVELVVAERVG